MTKIVVDQNACIGCELCVAICPSVFKINGNGKSEPVKAGHPDAKAPECIEARDACPVGAIKIED